MRILGIDGVDFPDYAAQNRRENAITAAREAVIAAAKAWRKARSWRSGCLDTEQDRTAGILHKAVNALNALEATNV